MSTMIRSDIYRLRHGAAVRNTCIVLIAIMAVFAVIFVVLRSDQFSSFVESGAIEQFEEGEADEFKADFSEAQDYIPGTAAEFTNSLMSENILIFFFIPIVLAVFCTDFTDGTYRNTLSFESNRKKVYLAKLGVSVVTCFLLQILMVVAGWLMGGIAFGTLGFSSEYFIRLIVSILLLLPGQLSTVCFMHCVIAYTKKSGAAIGIYIGVCLVLSMVLQLLAMIPQFDWLIYLDWNSVGKMLMSYWNAPLFGLVLAIGSGLLVAVVSTVLGLRHYQKADLTL